jgi:hypothetical protein
MRARLLLAVLCALCLSAGALASPANSDTTANATTTTGAATPPAAPAANATTTAPSEQPAAPPVATSAQTAQDVPEVVVPYPDDPAVENDTTDDGDVQKPTIGATASPVPGAPVIVPAPAVRTPSALPPTRSLKMLDHGKVERAPAERPKATGGSTALATPTTPPATVTRPRRPVAERALARYDIRSDPKRAVGITVAAMLLLQVVGGGGLALAAGLTAAGGLGLGMVGGEALADGAGLGAAGAAGASRSRDRKGRKGGSLRGAKVKHLKGGVEGMALGDRSRTWRWPGTGKLDALSQTLPPRIAAASPLLARIFVDGGYLRSMLGSASAISVIGGFALGAMAVDNVGGAALPPSATLAIAIAVVGVLDAAAGFAAVLVFMTGVAISGGIDSADSVRTLLGLCGLWFVVPLCAGAARPLRRPPLTANADRFERTADVVIASLMGAWIAQKIILSLPGLAGYRLPIAHYANTAAYVILAAVAVRIVLETVAIHLYPQRLATVHADDIPWPSEGRQVLAAMFRTGLFVFFAIVAVGNSWQLVVGAAIFLASQFLFVFERRLPTWKPLQRVVPVGLFKTVLMLFVMSAFAAWALSQLKGSDNLIGDSFVLLALPGTVLALVAAFGGKKPDKPFRWRRAAAGTAVLMLGVMQVLGLLL